MNFLPEQVAEYDRKRAQAAEAPQIELFVSDERSAIEWLTEFLKKRPSTYQDVHPEFITQIGAGWRKHEEKPELEGSCWKITSCATTATVTVPTQIHSYLSTNFKELRSLDKDDPRLMAKAKDRWYVPDPNKAAGPGEAAGEVAAEGVRDLPDPHRPAAQGVPPRGPARRLQDGLVAEGLQTIIKVAEKIPEDALQEDEKLLLWYDQALTLSETGG